jgi:hypothetical protein
MFLASLLALSLSAGGCGLPPASAGSAPWRTGETLTYDLDLLGAVRTGTLAISVERPISGGTLLTFRGVAKSNPSLPRRIAAVALSWVEAGSLLPQRYREEVENGEEHRTSDATLRPPGPKVVIVQQNRAQKAESSFDRTAEVLDPLSALFYLRAASPHPGDRYCFDLVALGRLWHVEATVAAKQEKVETGVGKLDTFRIDAVARRADKPEARRPIHAWFTMDARRLLVAAVSEVDLGPVRATLASVRGARGK